MNFSLPKSLPFLLIGLFCLSSAPLNGIEFRGSPTLSTETAPQASGFPFSLFGPRYVKVILIGDSLSFGPFGERLESLLKNAYGRNQVCVFASCGSSPEGWINGTPSYVTKCGYRQFTPNPRECYIRDFNNGRRPSPVDTPKLSKIFSEYHSGLVIIQQGTNWMDQFKPGKKEDIKRIGRYLHDMIFQIRRDNPGARIIWILPPAASKYPQDVQSQIAAYIRRCGEAYKFRCIDSRRITGQYVKGVSGRDGVHYSTEPAHAWADKTYQRIRALVEDDQSPAP
jgi:hypothetical protein